MKRLTTLVFAILLAIAFLSPGYSAPKFGACKGLSKNACSKSSGCVWVKGHTRKNGAQVKAHCRGKGKKGFSKSKSKKGDLKNKKSKGDLRDKNKKKRDKKKYNKRDKKRNKKNYKKKNGKEYIEEK